MIELNEFARKAINPEPESFYTGVCEDNADPEKLGRLKVRVKEIYGDIPTEHLPWAVPMIPFSGPGYGMFMIPEPGARIQIVLNRDHPWFPHWIGTHWLQGETPEESKLNPPENYVLVKTPDGNIIDINDKIRYIRMKDQNGNYIIINTAEDTLNISINQNKREETGGYSDETVGSSKRVKAGANIDLQADGSVNISARGALNLEGTSVNIISHGLLNMQAAGVMTLLTVGLMYLAAYPTIMYYPDMVQGSPVSGAIPGNPESPETPSDVNAGNS